MNHKEKLSASNNSTYNLIFFLGISVIVIILFNLYLVSQINSFSSTLLKTSSEINSNLLNARNELLMNLGKPSDSNLKRALSYIDSSKFNTSLLLKENTDNNIFSSANNNSLKEEIQKLQDLILEFKYRFFTSKIISNTGSDKSIIEWNESYYRIETQSHLIESKVKSLFFAQLNVSRWAQFSLLGICILFSFITLVVLYKSEKQRGSHLKTIRDTSLDLEKGIRKATKVEEALEENKRRMNILIQNLPGMVYRYNANNIWHFTYVNDKCRQITGYTYEELINNTSVTYYDLINEEDRKNNLHQIQDAIEGKKPFQLIYRIKTAQGYEKWLWEQGVGIFSDKDDELVAIEGFIIDITEQKTIEDQLNLQSYALEAAANGIVITDKEGKLLWANSAFTELTGYSVKEVMGKKLSFLNSGMYDASYYAYMWNKINSGEIWKGEIINKRKDGILYTEEMTITPVNRSDNEIIYFVAIKQDITERKKAEIALSESERNFRGLFENATIGIYRSTPDGIFIMANPALLKIFGYDSFKEFAKLNAADGYIDPDKRLLFIKQLKEKGNLFGFEAEWKKKDGTIIFIRETARTVKDTDGNLMYYEGTVEDITEKKKIEEALIESKVHAEKSDQLKSEFLAQMSHEIRTPLNVILSFSSMMKEELQNQVDEEMYNAFEVIVTEGKRITRTVELILNMSELQTNSYNYHAKRINLLKDVIQKIYNTQKSVAEQKNIIYELTCNDSDTTILADEYSVNQIFSHIIENAIKYTQQGKVEINIKRDPRNNIYVDIIDTGIGISNDYLPMLFTPFSREEKGYTRNFEGNGLGLALVKKYCDLNNAEIKVTSVKGKGSIFRITFLPPK